MQNLLKYISFLIGKRNAISSKDANLNLLDVGCSSSIPDHFVRYAEYINLLGCDPDLLGIKKVKKKPYINEFNSIRFVNVAASNESKKSFLEIAQKRTGSQLREKNSNENFIEVDLLKTSLLQDRFASGSANIIKVDAEGHELEVIEGINFNSDELLCVEVECTLNQENNNLSSIISLLEDNNFFIATFRYHNHQTLSLSTFKNKYYRFIYKILRKIPFLNFFNSMWTDLSGKTSFHTNKSFLYQIELVFLKRNSYIPKKHLKKYNNILLIYGFIRYFSKLKTPKFVKFIIEHFPSR